MMEFRHMSLQLLNAYRGDIVTLYPTEIVSMSDRERKEILSLRSSPVCGLMQYVDENGSVTELRLRTVSGPPLGERVLCYVRQGDSAERYIIFSRYAPLILNGGNIESRAKSLLHVEGDPDKFIPEGVIFDHSIILTSFDLERILVVSCQDPQFVMVGDLALSVYNSKQEKTTTIPSYRIPSTFQQQPKEVLVVRTDTSDHGMESLEQYLPFLGTWTYVGHPLSVFNNV